jgi:hypothetical protein
LAGSIATKNKRPNQAGRNQELEERMACISGIKKSLERKRMGGSLNHIQMNSHGQLGNSSKYYAFAFPEHNQPVHY